MTYTIIETKCTLRDCDLETARRMAASKGADVETMCAVYGILGIMEWGIKNPSAVEVREDRIVHETVGANGEDRG